MLSYVHHQNNIRLYVCDPSRRIIVQIGEIEIGLDGTDARLYFTSYLYNGIIAKRRKETSINNRVKDCIIGFLYYVLRIGNGMHCP